MESIVNRLTEIEDAATAIVQHAEDQKEALNKEYDEKRRKFDEDLEKKTQERISVIRDKLEKKTSQLLDSQSGSSDAVIQALQKEYSERKFTCLQRDRDKDPGNEVQAAQAGAV